MKKLIKKLIRVFIVIGLPITFLCALWLKFVRKLGTNKVNDIIFMRLGILPILDHYYEPMINPKKHLIKSLRDDRELAAINLNIDEQLALLSKFNYNDELLKFPLDKRKDVEFYYNNSSFISGDAEFLFNMVRLFKPAKIIEIGSGLSTLMVRNALVKNQNDDELYACSHICIEPYEKPWLEQIDIQLLRKKVEDVDKIHFQNLEANDILFIDSSHMIRPQGDVLFEYLEILPLLKSGVIVHVHDIFTPKDYPDEWVYNHFFWNEQYLLEAFLMFNNEFRIVGALNFLSHNYKDQFSEKCPIYSKQPGKEPGSFWMIKN